MSTPHPTTLAFDDVVIDFVGRRLLRGGEPQALEPKAFGVLALLAGAPGQAFARDAILDVVWGHRHVTPGVLNRVMTMLRHALGEDAHTPRYLHTLHGIGYRFDLPAGVVAPTAPPTDTPAPIPATAPMAAEPHQRRAQDHTRPRAVNAVSGRWLGAIALIAIAGVALWFWQREPAIRARLPSVAATSSSPTLIVIPLKSIGNAPRDDDVAAGLSEELIGTLARIDGLRVIARESTGIAAAQASDIAALVPRLGISHALEGSLRQSGEQLRIHVRLIEAASGRLLWTQDYDRDVADVLAVEREIADAVAASLRLKLGLSSALASRGGDAEFHRRYQKSRALLRSDVEQAEGEFRALVKLRPQDARAHAGLAFALNARAFHRPLLADTLRVEALQEAGLARSLDPSLPEPHLVLAGAACRNNHWERCLGLNRTAMSLASDTTSYFQYAMSLAALGYLDRAREVLESGIARDPLNTGLHYGHGRLLDTIGEHALARKAFARAVGTHPYGAWFNAIWRRDYAEAQRYAEAMGENPLDRENGPRLERSHLAASIALADPTRWPEAKAAGRAFEAETGLMDFLRVFHPDADAAAIIQGFERVRKRDYSTWDLLLWTRDLPYIRRDPAFQRYLRRSGIADYWKKHGYPPQCKPRSGGATCA
ncbi:MAG: winged helix-turn-helix domain-containing protein [Lysobacter sp.]|nr:winged helix-turn-helix domain-containing protein [Lysobacter sp.]